jgi:hypothetical protein
MNDGGEHDQGVGRPVGERPTTTNEAPAALESPPHPRLQRGRLRRRPFEEMQLTDESTAAAAALVGASSEEESRRGAAASWDRTEPIRRMEGRPRLPLPPPPAESSALEVLAALEPTPFPPGRGASIPPAVLLPGHPPPGDKVPGALPFAAEDATLAEKRGVANVDPPHPHPPLTHHPHRFITDEALLLGAPTLALERLASWINGSDGVSPSRQVLPSEPAPSDNMLHAMSETSQANERIGPESTLMGTMPGAPQGVAFAGAAADWPRPLLSRHSSLPPPPSPPTGALIHHQVHRTGGPPIPFWQAQASLMDALSSSSMLSSSAVPSSRLPFTYGLEALSSDLFHARNQGWGGSCASAAAAAVTSPNQSLSSSVWAPQHPALTRLPFPHPQQDLATTVRADPFASRGDGGDGGIGEAKSPSHELPSSPPLLGQQGRSPLLLQPAGLDQLFRVDRLLNVPSAATYSSLLHTNNAATKPGETNPPALPTTTFASLHALHNSQSHVLTFPRDSSLLTSPRGPIPLSMHPQMGRLKESMEESERTQRLLQDWDKLHGLPKSHSTTMVCTSRSRTQLLEGRILAKWDGTPLISREGRPEPKSRPRRIAATKASADDPSSIPSVPLPELARAPGAAVAAAAAAHDAKTPKDASSSSSDQDESEGSGDDCSSTTDDGLEAEGVD